MSQSKFTEVAKTIRIGFICAAIIAVCTVGFVVIKWFSSGSGSETKITAAIEGVRLAKCQEVVVAKATCNVKAEIAEHQSVMGFDLGKYAPGSKDVKYDGPAIIRFGYDSTLLMFPKGVTVEKNRSGAGLDEYVITIPSFPDPKVLPDPSLRDYVKESPSMFTGSIPADTFYRYVDSLVRVAGNKTVANQRDYFRDAYAKMAFELLKGIFGEHSFSVVIGDMSYEEQDIRDIKLNQEFSEDIQDKKFL